MALDPNRNLRPDFTNCLFHFTKEREGETSYDFETGEGDVRPATTALEVLREILSAGIIRGSNHTGFIKGASRAVCLTEIPLSYVKYYSRPHQYGIAISKGAAFRCKARPVIYLPEEESGWVPAPQKWRVVRYEYGEVDWTHEREWRLKGDLELRQLRGFYVVVWEPSDRGEIEDLLADYANVLDVLPLKHVTQQF